MLNPHNPIQPMAAQVAGRARPAAVPAKKGKMDELVVRGGPTAPAGRQTPRRHRRVAAAPGYCAAAMNGHSHGRETIRAAVRMTGAAR